MQSQAIILNDVGAADNFKLSKIALQPPKENEVQVRHGAIGINFFDVCFRRGQYKISKMPAILGMEACGYVEEVGEAVRNFKVGDRVAYATGGIGAYCDKRNINEHHLIAATNNLTDIQVAATLHKGLMAHALLHRVFIAKRAKKALIHAAAGGVGHILCQWAKHLGLEIFATVGNHEKEGFVKSLGCNHIIDYSKQDFVEEIANLTDHGGVGIVYDGVGKEVINKSIDCLWPMGMYVGYGEASGSVENFDINRLFLNSLYMAKPTMALYKANRVELALSAAEVFAAVEKGIIKPKVTTYEFGDIAKAHKDLESRQTMGSLVLLPPK